MAELNLLGRLSLCNILRESLRTRLLINETIQQIPDVLKVCVGGSKEWCQGCTPSPGPKFLIFAQFSGIFCQNNRLTSPTLRLASPPLENPGIVSYYLFRNTLRKSNLHHM